MHSFALANPSYDLLVEKFVPKKLDFWEMSRYTSSNLRAIPDSTVLWSILNECNAPDKDDKTAYAADLSPIPSLGWARWLFKEESFFLIPLIQG